MQATKSGNRSNGHPRRGRGYAILWCLITLLLFITIGSFALELSWLRLAESKARTAAEAGALAAAGSLMDGRTISAANAAETCDSNEGPNGPVILIPSAENDSSDISFGRWDAQNGTFEEALVAPDAVRTRIEFSDAHPNGAVNLLLTGFLGLDSAEVGSEVVAHRRPEFPVPVVGWVLEALQPNGLSIRSSQMDVNGALEVHSNSPQAVSVLNDGLLRGSLIDIQGDIQLDSDEGIRGMVRFDPPTTPPPSLPAMDLEGIPNQLPIIDSPGTKNLPPGHYQSGLVGSLGQYVLADGVYLFGGAGIDLSGNASLAADNVIIVLDDGAGLRIDGAEISIRTSESVGAVDNPDLIALAAISQVKSSILLEQDALLEVKGIIHAPRGLLSLNDGTMTCLGFITRNLTGTSGSSITAGPDTPHPVQLELVR